jgi:hypothetical protein
MAPSTPYGSFANDEFVLAVSHESHSPVRFVAEAAHFCFRVKAEARQKAGFGAIGAG